MELCFASFCSILRVVIPFNGDTVFAVDFCFTVCYDLLLAGLACHFDDRPFEVFLVMGFLRTFPVVTSVAIHLSDHLKH